jgi:hypothetical protein
MDSEIMSIMSQYMPLDSQNNENQPLRQHESEAQVTSLCSQVQDERIWY